MTTKILSNKLPDISDLNIDDIQSYKQKFQSLVESKGKISKKFETIKARLNLQTFLSHSIKPSSAFSFSPHSYQANKNTKELDDVSVGH